MKRSASPPVSALKCHFHAAVKREGLERRDHARIASKENGRRLLRIGARIEESAISRVSIVKEIVDEPEKLHMLVELIGGVQICDPIKRQFRILVREIANEILRAGNKHI